MNRLQTIFAAAATTLLPSLAMAAPSTGSLVNTGLSTLFGAAVGLVGGIVGGVRLTRKESGDGSAKIGLIIMAGIAGAAAGGSTGMGLGLRYG